MNYKDYYKILGITKSATDQEIKRAFRKLAIKYHPDKNPDDPVAAEKFKEINEANEVLSDPDKRKKYDELGTNWQHFQQGGGQQDFDWSQWQQPGGGTYYYEGDPSDAFGADFSDFFKNIFGGMGSRTSRGRAAFKGQDYQAELQLSLDEAYHGTKRVIQLHNQKIRVTTKPGTADGQTLRIKGKGGPGIQGGPAGDLYLKIHIFPHPKFEREGDHLIQNIEIDLFKAVLGGKIRVDTFTGTVQMHIPAGIQSGAKLRLKGKGMPAYGKKNKLGNMYVLIQVRIPHNLSGEEKELYEKLRTMSRKGQPHYAQN